MMNKDQESDCDLKKFTEENSLHFHPQKSASTLTMEFIGQPALQYKNHHNYTLTEVANYLNA